MKNNNNNVITKILALTGISTLKFRLEKVLCMNSMKEVEAGLDKLIEERGKLYSHVAQEDGVVKAIDLMREEGILADIDTLAVAVGGLGVRTGKKLIGIIDGAFEHTEDEAKWLTSVRNFYGGVRKIADTIVEKGLEVAKMLVKGIWAIIKKAVAFIISLILKAINKIKGIVASDDDVDDDEAEPVSEEAKTVAVEEMTNNFGNYCAQNQQ